MSISDETILVIIEWLSSDESHGVDDAGLIAGLGRRLRAAGLPVDRLSLHLRTLHPEIMGRRWIWHPKTGVTASSVGYDLFDNPEYRYSPIKYVFDEGKRVRRRLGLPATGCPGRPSGCSCSQRC